MPDPVQQANMRAIRLRIAIVLLLTVVCLFALVLVAHPILKQRAMASDAETFMAMAFPQEAVTLRRDLPYAPFFGDQEGYWILRFVEKPSASFVAGQLTQCNWEEDRQAFASMAHRHWSSDISGDLTSFHCFHDGLVLPDGAFCKSDKCRYVIFQSGDRAYVMIWET